MNNVVPSSVSTYHFQLSRDAFGIRETISLDNESGCPFKCTGCGVWKDPIIVSSEENRHTIGRENSKLKKLRQEHASEYAKHGSHVIVYNSGNVMNKRELSEENLRYLLTSLNQLEAMPSIVALNTRGLFVTHEVLDQLTSIRLGYRIDFNFGLETRTLRGKAIYGKPNIDGEFTALFSTVRAYNEKNDAGFGLMVNFVFLPESYLLAGEARENAKEKIHDGFVSEIKTFMEEYADHGVPLRLNLHPFYRVNGIPFADSNLDDFMSAATDVLHLLAQTNPGISEKRMRVSAFVGVQDNGYSSESWKNQIKFWQTRIDHLNWGGGL